MPIYSYKCPECGKKFDRFLKLAEYMSQQICDCGHIAEKQVTAPFIQPDFPAYNCPITGKLIEGRRAHDRNLKLHGCRVLEKGETEAAVARRKAEDEALENTLAETAAKLVSEMPSRKQEQLATELSAGADVQIVRL